MYISTFTHDVKGNIMSLDNNQYTSINFRVTNELNRAIEQQAEREGRDKSSMVRWACQQYLEKERQGRELIERANRGG